MKVICGNRLEDYYKEKEEIKEVENDEKASYNFKDILQIETARISKEVELMIILGKKKTESSNSLYDIAIRICNNAMIVETMEDLYLNYIKRFKVVGIVATKEMPEYFIERIVEILQNIQTEGYIYESSRKLERL